MFESPYSHYHASFIICYFVIMINFYPNTSIGGIDVSNMTLSEAKNAVQTDLKIMSC